eukprot:3969439-Amphidinium_carterae.1
MVCAAFPFVKASSAAAHASYRQLEHHAHDCSAKTHDILILASLMKGQVRQTPKFPKGFTYAKRMGKQ